MNKNVWLAALVLFTASVAFAAETQRYLVATHLPVTEQDVDDFGDSSRKGMRRLGAVAFRQVNGMAVDLTADEARALRRNANVRYVEPIVSRRAFSTVQRNAVGQTIPYGVDLVEARKAWTGTRGAGINVVVVDSGIDYNHPDLKQIYAGGYDTFKKTTDALDDNGHGTHVAGTIAAADNEFGVVGVAPAVRLWAVKVLNAKGEGSSDKVVAALDWIIARKRALGGNWVVNLSLGSEEGSALEREAFARAADAGLLIFAASGNDSEPEKPAPVSYPAAYDGVLAVGAIDYGWNIASFSNQGPELALVAPGVSVLSSARVGSGTIATVNAGDIARLAAAVGGSSEGTITGEMVYSKRGNPADFPANIKGKVALIQRGDITFGQKVRNAMAAGAAACIIYNTDDSEVSWTLGSSTPSASTTWPLVVGISRQDGESLVAQSGKTVTVSLGPDDYTVMSGTSMAAPHAAGVAALVWAFAPSATVKEVTSALLHSARDLGAPSTDSIYGNGMITAVGAAKLLAPTVFVPEAPHGRRVLRRGH